MGAAELPLWCVRWRTLEARRGEEVSAAGAMLLHWRFCGRAGRLCSGARARPCALRLFTVCTSVHGGVQGCVSDWARQLMAMQSRVHK